MRRPMTRTASAALPLVFALRGDVRAPPAGAPEALVSAVDVAPGRGEIRAVGGARYLSLHDLLAMIALQYRNVGLEPLWSLLETALLEPAAESWLDAGPEPLAHYADGEVRLALFDPGAWHARYAPGAADCSALERGFEYFQARQRQFAAVLEAHAVPVQYVHCADGNADCLR